MESGFRNSKPSGFGLVFFSIAVLIMFVFVETKSTQPMLDVSIFRRNVVFAMSNFAALLNYSATFAVAFLLSLYLQIVKGLSPQNAGIILLTQPLVMAEKFQSMIAYEIDMKSEENAKKTALLYANFAEQKGSKVLVKGKLNEISALALNDADRGYHNDGRYFEEKYGMSAKEALYLWHTSLGAIAKKLEQDQRFEESLFIKIQVLMRAVEPAYNFYGIEATPIDIIGAALLAFYVIYTVWWGFAIYFMFEGMGIKVTKAKSKKEV